MRRCQEQPSSTDSNDDAPAGGKVPVHCPAALCVSWPNDVESTGGGGVKI